MANVYFGNSLSDLQGALTAADRLEAERAMARARNETQLTSQNSASQMQREALRQQAEQQRMAQSGTDYFNRGRLMNEQERIRADRMLAEQQARLGAERFAQEDATRRYVADTTAGARNRTPEIASQEAELAAAAEGFAKILNDRDALQADLVNIAAIDKGKQKMDTPLTLESTAEARFQPQLSGYFANQPIDFGAMSYDQALAGAQGGVQQQLENLTALVTAGAQSGVANLVAKGPDGRWVSTFRPSQPRNVLGTPPKTDNSNSANGAAVPNYFRPSVGDLRAAESAMPMPPASSFGQFREGQIIYRMGVPYRVVNGQPVPISPAQ